MKIDIKNLSFGYTDKQILKSINFSASSRDFLGILGANGSGKSTLLKNISGLLNSNHNSVYFDNIPIENYSKKQLSRMIGFVPQKSFLSAPFLVEEVVLMGRFAHMKNAFSGYNKEDHIKVDEVLELLGISDFKNRDTSSLSGGEFSKVLIARALVAEPKILLLDEPTSALDLNYAVEMMKICKKLTDELGLISIAVIHDLNLASMFCNRLIMLKKGNLVYSGTSKELYTTEILKDVYDLKCDILEYKSNPLVVAIKE
ncbi:heme ABC transporter ChuBCD, ATP-binding protein [Campylobacter pinnipediorum subsp. caledonicus]|uniref:Heme ABC transporter ChuBCD, ATP-binding protein n=1 Tax=Campylobacter pinnipediorum subsp. caledonicus TaxID=1874362 RepID=A0A1S6U6L2_9BACT|nr:ABC transporter ATP-binding protein [Campylobacter pinnipediorum]AQW85770.1 heme ABC transporter ChuBCD, ATP-binding protein [Campylobacter pinnipediorum subsp. caledonicus]AQW87381.1 heme ABC transporter ChuBCD, ATP-binding protein [Campylobacter pinnipediorum subsp. caledonicus]OPA72541.1 heme ABC transporter ATP-binding protein [Campylobacter pinnipediorum subsp. caledonicus]